jgi:hypothetical protein
MQSALAENVLTKRLYESVETYSGFRWDNYTRSSKPFVGKVSETTFDIRPVFEGRNSFIPFVHGVIEKGATGSRVTLTMRLHYVVAIFLTLLTCLMIFSIIRYHELFGILFILFVYVMTISFFNIEYKKTRRILQKIFESQGKL